MWNEFSGIMKIFWIVVTDFSLHPDTYMRLYYITLNINTLYYTYICIMYVFLSYSRLFQAVHGRVYAVVPFGGYHSDRVAGGFLLFFVGCYGLSFNKALI